MPEDAAPDTAVVVELQPSSTNTNTNNHNNDDDNNNNNSSKQEEKQQQPLIEEQQVHLGHEIQLVDPREPKGRQSAVRLIPIIGREWITILIGICFAVAQGVVPPAFFLLLGTLFTKLATSSPEQVGDETTYMAKLVACLAVAPTFISFFEHLLFQYGAQRVGNRIKKAYFDSCIKQEIGFFDIKKSGAIAHSLSDDVNKVTDMFSTQLQSVFQYIAQFFAGIIIALTKNWTMALLQMVSIPLMIFVYIISASILRRLAIRSSIQSAASVATANEVITSMKTVRSMAGEFKEMARYARDLDKVKRTGFFFSITRGTSIGINSFWIWGAVALAFWYAGKMLDDGRMNVGELISVFGCILVAIIGLIQIFIVIPEILKAQASVQLLLKVMLREPAIPVSGGGKTIENLRGRIQIENVTFRYPSRPKVEVLKNFSLEIEPGTSCALVGSSGSGKSTIIGLLERWYEPEQGTIKIDGIDIKELDPQWLHRVVGLVSQEPTLFATTIKRNITYAVDTINSLTIDAARRKNPKASEEEIMASVKDQLIPVTDEIIFNAAKAANAHDFIMKLADGYETVIGERGVSLSGGQKQRIAIARAVMQDPRILMLDEATSALDTKSEALVQEALEKLMVGRTSIVIAHRLTTIQDCDKIVVMRRGEIVEMGTHNDDQGQAGRLLRPRAEANEVWSARRGGGGGGRRRIQL